MGLGLISFPEGPCPLPEESPGPGDFSTRYSGVHYCLFHSSAQEGAWREQYRHPQVALYQLSSSGSFPPFRNFLTSSPVKHPHMNLTFPSRGVSGHSASFPVGRWYPQ